jgi:hypothetical protein
MVKRFCDVCPPRGAKPSAGTFKHEEKGEVDLCPTHIQSILTEMINGNQDMKERFEAVFNHFYKWRDDHTCA